MGPTWVLSAPDGPMLVPWTLLSGQRFVSVLIESKMHDSVWICWSGLRSVKHLCAYVRLWRYNFPDTSHPEFGGPLFLCTNNRHRTVTYRGGMLSVFLVQCKSYVDMLFRSSFIMYRAILDGSNRISTIKFIKYVTWICPIALCFGLLCLSYQFISYNWLYMTQFFII